MPPFQGEVSPQFTPCISGMGGWGCWWGWRAWYELVWGESVCAVQLPGVVEAGSSSWSLASVLRCFLLHSWKLNGFAAAEESLPLGAHVTTVPHGKGDLMGQGDVGWQPCCCLVCLSVKKWLNVAVHLLDITKAINKWYQAFLRHIALTGQGNV